MEQLTSSITTPFTPSSMMATRRVGCRFDIIQKIIDIVKTDLPNLYYNVFAVLQVVATIQGVVRGLAPSQSSSS